MRATTRSMTTTLTPNARRAAAALGAAALTLLPALASAQDAQLYDWPDATTPALVMTSNGVIYLHKDGQPLRAYSFAPLKIKGQPSMIAVNLDQDAGPEILGMGKPTFALSSSGAPLWTIDKGCRQVMVADIIADKKLEILCVQGNEIKALTHDNQFAWGLSLGRSFGLCAVADTNGDLKADIECKVGSKIARLDGAKGQLITADATESMIPEGTSTYDALEPVGPDSLTLKASHDFNGDGTAEEYVEIQNDTALGVLSKSSPKPLFVVELKQKPTQLLVKDLDGDKKPEIIVLTAKSLMVISSDGKRVEAFSLDAKKYKRKPLAEFESLYPSNFQDQDAAAQSVRALQGDLSKCYTSALQKSGFAGSGRLILKVQVDDQGKLTQTGIDFSEINDKKIDQCAVNALKKGKYAPAKAGETGSINVTIRFTFRDQDR